MNVQTFNSDPEKLAIILLVQKIKVYEPQIGAYIEHFTYSEEDIIIKLTNGFLKVKEYLVDSVARNNNDISLVELKKSAKTFIKTQL